MSTAAVYAPPASSWKQEVNRCLAKHRGRKPSSQAESQVLTVEQHSASLRAQEAAARVAARYAKAPSYSEMLATEARAALHAAEAASQAALQAKAAAESVLANIEAASATLPAAETAADKPLAVEPVLIDPVVNSQSSPLPEPIAKPPRISSMEHGADDAQPLSVRWAPELPARPAEVSHQEANHNSSLYNGGWWKPTSDVPLDPDAGEPEIVEPALPIAGNLIEFPRELIATRKVRPRLSESPHADGANVQLSIFEVDPVTVATEPSADAVQAYAGEWAQPAWSGIELDDRPLDATEELLEEPATQVQPVRQMEPASWNRRFLALFLDGTLISGILVGATALVLDKITILPSPHTLEHVSAIALAVISALYITGFYSFAPATPGMTYASIRFCTFDGLAPTRAQRWSRLAAMLLSVLPAGLGLAWSLFDDDRLCWHDRLSRTYICNR